jgi:hypothetical protein
VASSFKNGALQGDYVWFIVDAQDPGHNLGPSPAASAHARLFRECSLDAANSNTLF